MPLAPNINDELCCLGRKIAAVVADVDALQEDVDAIEAATLFGNATLVGGTIAVANTKVTANSIIVVGRKTIGGTVGNNSYTLNPGVGFTLNSSSVTDTSTLSYHIKY